MAAIENLPTEIVNSIISEFKDDKRILCILSRVSRIFRANVEKKLYQRAVLHDLLSLQLFLQTLCKTPRLASYVAHLQFRQLAVPLRQLSNDASGSDTGASLVSLALSTACNVTAVDLGNLLGTTDDMIEVVDKHLTRSITTIRYGLDSIQVLPVPANSLQVLSTFLGRPLLRNLHGHVVDGDGNHMLGMQTISNIICLELYRSHLREESLHDILGQTPYLKALICDLWFDADPEDDYSAFIDCKKIQRAFESAALVETLHLSVNFFANVAMEIDYGGTYENDHFWGLKNHPLSLRNMAHLHDVRVPIALLFGLSSGSLPQSILDALPRTLRSLTLTYDLHLFYTFQWSSGELIQHLAGNLSQETFRLQFPAWKLFTLVIEDYLADELWSEDEFERLSVTLKRLGIVCAIVKTSG